MGYISLYTNAPDIVENTQSKTTSMAHLDLMFMYGMIKGQTSYFTPHTKIKDGS